MYVLILKLNQEYYLRAGRLSPAQFPPGIYFYVGRAKKGLYSRINRHLRKEKKFYWHIDYFLQRAQVEEVWIKPGCVDECLTASSLKSCLHLTFSPPNNFGASDCSCPTHLFYVQSNLNPTNLLENLHFQRINLRTNFYGN